MWEQDDRVVAILCADLHLSLNPPIWRSAEPDWFEAMKRPLNEIRELQQKYKCEVICAGDIFDRWNSQPELINFALSYLPDMMYAIPGQHDLPLHNYEDIGKSAYMTLVKADKIQNILPGCFVELEDMVLSGFPFGFDLTGSNRIGKKLHIAVVHKYVWVDGAGYPGAPEDVRIPTKREKDWLFRGYDVIQFGDNHMGFSLPFLKQPILNCGTMMRRKSDEVNYVPLVGLLLSSGFVKTHFLDISQDKFLTSVDNKTVDVKFDMKAFCDELEKLGATEMDFAEAVRWYLEKENVRPQVKNVIMKGMENGKNGG